MKAHIPLVRLLAAGIIARSLFHAYMVQPFQAFPSMLELPSAVQGTFQACRGKQACTLSSHSTRVGSGVGFGLIV